MPQPLTTLTKEIIESDELWHKWLWGELYEAIRPLLPEIEKELEEYSHEVIDGTGKGKPIGMLNRKDIVE